MRIKKDLVRKVLEKLYEDYFPEACPVDTLCEALGGEKQKESMLAVGCYLKDRGLIIETSTIGDKHIWRITASGINSLEGGSLI